MTVKSLTLDELDRILERDTGYVNALLTIYTESQTENERLRAALACVILAAEAHPDDVPLRDVADIARMALEEHHA